MMKSLMEQGNYFLSVNWKFSIEFKERFFTNAIIITNEKIKTTTKFLYVHVCVLVKINYSQWSYTVGWSPKEYQVGKSLLTNCHLEDETEAGQKCWVKTKSLCYMYSAVNKKTVQQCITKVMADVINHITLITFTK